MSILTDEELLAAIDEAPVVRPDTSATQSTGTTKRINFSGLKEKPKANGRKDYPTLPDTNGEASKLADEFLKQHAAEAEAKGAKEIARAMLVEQAVPFHWNTNCGRGEVEGTVSVRSSTGGEVLVQFKDSYKAIADIKDKAGNIIQSADQRIKALPPEVFAKYFRETFTVEIDSNKIAEDQLQTVVDRLQQLASELGIEGAVSVASCFKPVESWHVDRYRTISAEQNMKIEKAMGERGLMTIAVTTARGRKK